MAEPSTPHTTAQPASPAHLRMDDQLASSMFGRTVAELCLRHNLRCTVRLNPDPSAPAGAVTNPITRRVVVARATLAENSEEQAWTAAHEVGHLVDARSTGLLRYLPWRYFGWLFAGLVVLAGVVLFVTSLPIVQQQPLAARLGIAALGLLAGFVAFGGCARLAMLRLGAHQRPLEDAADRFAKHEGYPLTPVIAGMLDRQERRKNGQPPGRRWQRYRCHRYPTERINSTPAADAPGRRPPNDAQETPHD